MLLKDESRYSDDTDLETGEHAIVVMPSHDDGNLVGTVFDDCYIIESLIDSTISPGISINLYAAHDTVRHSSVVIKHLLQNTVPATSPNSGEKFVATMERFKQEARALSLINHHAVVKIHDAVIKEFDNHAMAYIVMDKVEGVTLDQYLKGNEQELSFHAFVALFSQVLEALELAHEKGIIHRDIKPANIMVEAAEKIKLVDFGIAQIPRFYSDARLTHTGDMLGTPIYMSPEQCLGQNVDQSSDLYSVGCVMFEALTGEPPYSGENILALMTKKVEARPANLVTVAKIDREQIVQIERIISKAMARLPEQRYQRAGEMLKDLLSINSQSKSMILKLGEMEKRKQRRKSYFAEQIQNLVALTPTVLTTLALCFRYEWMPVVFVVASVIIPLLAALLTIRASIALVKRVNTVVRSSNRLQTLKASDTLAGVINSLPVAIALTTWAAVTIELGKSGAGMISTADSLLVFAAGAALFWALLSAVYWWALRRD